MCTVLLPPGDNPIAVNTIYHIIQTHNGLWRRESKKNLYFSKNRKKRRLSYGPTYIYTDDIPCAVRIEVEELINFVNITLEDELL